MMTERRARFVDYFILTGNAAEACRRAGFSAKNPDAYGAKLKKDPEIRAAIDERLRVLGKDRAASIGEVMTFLSEAMRGKVKDAKARDRIEAAKVLLTRLDGIGSEPLNITIVAADPKKRKRRC